MTENTADAARAQFAKFLPEAVRHVIESYEVFLSDHKGTDPKKFKDHHMACKVALTHLALLLKMDGEAPGEGGAPGEDITAELRKAMDELSEYKGENEEFPEEN